MIYLFFYRITYRFLILPGFWILAFFNPKIRTGLRLRAKVNGKRPWEFDSKNSQPIWIHASSMEFEYAKPVIRKLKNINPDIKILVTYFSPSAQKAVSSFEGVDFSCPSPWDLPRTIDNFLLFHNPRALLLARTDTWPEMLYQCKKRNIPTLLFSATFADSSSRLEFWGRSFFAWTLALIRDIYVVDNDDAKNLNSIGLKNYHVGGDTRYDQVFHRLENGKSISASRAPDGVTTFIAGSTWPQDEIILNPAINTLLEEGLPLRFILVPHEPTPTHIQSLRAQFPKANLYSQNPNSFGAGDILLVDQVGVLAELYKLADLALIGGSFVRNVHSVMESLACGNLTLVGPFHLNNREAIAFQKIKIFHSYTGVAPVFSSSQLVNYIKNYLLLSPQHKKEIKANIVSAVKSRQGATEKVLAWVRESGCAAEAD